MAAPGGSDQHAQLVDLVRVDVLPQPVPVRSAAAPRVRAVARGELREPDEFRSREPHAHRVDHRPHRPAERRRVKCRRPRGRDRQHRRCPALEEVLHQHFEVLERLLTGAVLAAVHTARGDRHHLPSSKVREPQMTPPTHAFDALPYKFPMTVESGRALRRSRPLLADARRDHRSALGTWSCSSEWQRLQSASTSSRDSKPRVR